MPTRSRPAGINAKSLIYKAEREFALWFHARQKQIAHHPQPLQEMQGFTASMAEKENHGLGS